MVEYGGKKRRSALPTDGALIRQRMKDVQRFGVPLFATPNQVYPSGQVLADVRALEGLEEREKAMLTGEVSPYPPV